MNATTKPHNVAGVMILLGVLLFVLALFLCGCEAQPPAPAPGWKIRAIQPVCINGTMVWINRPSVRSALVTSFAVEPIHGQCEKAGRE